MDKHRLKTIMKYHKIFAKKLKFINFKIDQIKMEISCVNMG